MRALQSVALALGLASAGLAAAAEHPVFAALQARTPAEARAECWRFLEQHQAAERSRRDFEAIWNDAARSLVDRVADSMALGDAEAARLLASARDTSASPARAVPAFVRDARRPAFLRANVALAYAQGLSRRAAYEETLDVLRLVQPAEVVDPAVYHFHRALAEHALLLRTEAERSIAALQDDVADAPERYRRVAALMDREMRGWRDHDLGAAARIMQNVGRRIEQARVDPTTYKMQSEIVVRLDELIRQLEQQPLEESQVPSPGPPPPAGRKPMPDSTIGKDRGDGNGLERSLRDLAEQWGKLPDRDQAEAMQALVRDLPPQYRALVEAYFRDLARAQSANGR